MSVKCGTQLNLAMVRDLVETVQDQKADVGVLITMDKETSGMVDAANHSGVFRAAAYDRDYPVVQIITIEDLLAGKRPNLPPVLLPYIQAQRHVANADQMALDV